MGKGEIPMRHTWKQVQLHKLRLEEKRVGEDKTSIDAYAGMSPAWWVGII